MSARLAGLVTAAVAVVAIGLGAPPTAAAQYGAVDGEWRSYAGDPGSTKYSPLDQIDAGNFGDLRIAWRWASVDADVDLEAVASDDERLSILGLQATPLMIDGVLYLSTALYQAAAVDAGTGETVWVHDPQAYLGGRPTHAYRSRGVAYWSEDDGSDARIFWGTSEAYLLAVDARTGEPIRDFGDDGRVDLMEGIPRAVRGETNYQGRNLIGVASPPAIARDVVLTPTIVSDFVVRREAPPGWVKGVDARTGDVKWVFRTVPLGDDFGADTWQNESWRYSGNANIWPPLSSDEELGMFYLPTGTPTSDYYGGHRLGDNLYAESLVCLDAATGERVWHFQFVHHGLWDYDVPAAPNLVDITVDGKQIKAVAQITKQGFIYVFDRETGEEVWPIEEREVPQTDVPGERTSPTQPFPTKPAPYEHQGFESDDMLISFTPELHEAAKKIRDQWIAGPLFTPPSLQGTLLLPGWGGGANWFGAAVDPETSTIYIPSYTMPMVVKLVEPDGARSNFRYVRGMSGVESFFLPGPMGLPLTRPPYGRITAIDLNTGEHAWMKPLGDGPRAQIERITGEDPGPLGAAPSAGPLLTKTLLFQAQGGGAALTGAPGGGDSVLRAHDKGTGDVIHEIVLDAAPNGTPMSYAVGGHQYIALAVGGEADAGIVALALPKAKQEG